MIRDTSGNELSYWPITGLEAEQDSDHLTIVVNTPQSSSLRAAQSTDITVFGRLAGSLGAFTDLTNTGLDLSGYAAPEQPFEVFARAGSAVTGVERVALFVGAQSSRPAGWSA